MKFRLFSCVTPFVALVAGAPLSDNDNVNTTSTTSFHPQDTAIVPHDSGAADNKAFDTPSAISTVPSPKALVNLCGLCDSLSGEYEDLCRGRCNTVDPTISAIGSWNLWEIEDICEDRCRYFKCPVISQCVKTCMGCHTHLWKGKRDNFQTPDRWVCYCIEHYGPESKHKRSELGQNSTIAPSSSDDIDIKLVIRPPPSDPVDAVRSLLFDIQKLGRMHQTLGNATLYNNPHGFSSDPSEPQPNLAEIDEFLREWVELDPEHVTWDMDKAYEGSLVRYVDHQRLEMAVQEAVSKGTKEVVARFPEVQRHVVRNIIKLAWRAAFVGSAANASAVA